MRIGLFKFVCGTANRRIILCFLCFLPSHPGLPPKCTYTMKMHLLIFHGALQLAFAGSPAWIACYPFENHLGIILSCNHGTKNPYGNLFRTALLLTQIRILHRTILAEADPLSKAMILKSRYLFPKIDSAFSSSVTAVPLLKGNTRRRERVSSLLQLNAPEVNTMLNCLTESMGRIVSSSVHV